MQQRNAIARLLTAALVSGAAATAAHAADPAPGTQATPAAATSEAYPGDAVVTSKVKAALLEDKQASALKINVSTTDGVVVLKGSIPSAEAAQHVIQVASAVPGVKDIKNELKLGN